MGMATCLPRYPLKTFCASSADPSKLQEFLHSEADDPPGWLDVEKACHANAVR